MKTNAFPWVRRSVWASAWVAVLLGASLPAMSEGLVLGDRVFRDADGNGRFDPGAGETGLGDVTLHLWLDVNANNLLDVDDQQVSTTATDSQGYYRFEGLAEGDYIVQVDWHNFHAGRALAGLASSGVDEADPDGDTDGDDNGVPVNGLNNGATLASRAASLRLGAEPTTEDGDADTNLTVDFGFQSARSLTLGNRVFADDNANGWFDPESGESGIPGVTVKLYRDANLDGSIQPEEWVADTVTDVGGGYEFGGLEEGERYRLEIARDNFLPGGPLAQRVPSMPVGWLFGAWDGDQNGVFLSPPLGVGSTEAREMVAGTLPLGEDGDPNTDLTVDFGFRPSPSLTVGDRVYADTDGDGRFEPEAGESGVEGVVVHLYRDADGTNGRSAGDVRVATTSTAGGGVYTFADLTPDDYVVEIAAANFAPGAALAGMAASPLSSWDPDDDPADGDNNGYYVWGFSVCANATRMDFGLEPGEEDGELNTNLTVDFGFCRPSGLRLGDMVWRDSDGNGQRDEGEPGIAGVYVRLLQDQGDGVFDGGEAEVANGQTDAEGRYRFFGLEAGTYLVRFEPWLFGQGQPLFGLYSSGGAMGADTDAGDRDHGVDALVPVASGISSTAIIMESGTEPEDDGDDADGNLTFDFGFTPTADPPVLSLGGRVWLDDGNGEAGTGELGIANVALFITRDGGDGVPTGDDLGLFHVWTDDEGRYTVTGLPAGGYWARVEGWNFNRDGALHGLMSSPGVADPELDRAGDDNGDDSSMPVNWGVSSGLLTLRHGEEPTDDGDDANRNQTLDFGFWSPPEPPILVLGGRVWRDLNADGRLDRGEPGVAGVGVSIIQVFENGSEIHQGGTGTDAGGNYRFYGRPAGRYLVQVDNWNFGGGSMLANQVSSPGAADADNNGMGDDNGRDTLLPGQTGLRSHVLTLSHGHEPEIDFDGDDADGNLTVDFGVIPALTLGDRVFRDANKDGSFGATDTGLDGITLHLFSDQNQSGRVEDGDWYLASTATASGGLYRFTGLAPGEYLVWVGGENFGATGALSGLATSPVDEADPDADGDHNDNGLVWYPHGIVSGVLTLVAGQEPATEDGDPNTNLTLDFGFQTARPLTLGNQVFADLNNNGMLEPSRGEAGIPRVEVRLYRDADGDSSVSSGDEWLASSDTDGEGKFEFTELAPTGGGAPYLLAIPALSFQAGGVLEGWISSDPAVGQGHEGSQDGVDHGRDTGPEARICTWHLHVNPGALPVNDDGDPNTDLTIDFGFTPELRIGNRVWADLDRDGQRDAGEPGIPGVEVHLVRDNGDRVLGDDDSVVQGTGTDAGGHYEFRGLTLGDYFVVIPPWNFEAGRALYNRAFRTGSAGPDPIDDVDDDDNGILWTVFGGKRVVSGRIELTVAGEPTSEDGNPNTNLTVDFGFVQGPLPSLGNLVWNDRDNDGRYEPLGADGEAGTADDEKGIGGVGVSLYRDDGDGRPNSGSDEGAMWTVTGPDGLYQFTGVLPGPYFIRIEYGSFAPGQPLFRYVSSTGVAAPGNGVDHDDNGMDEEFPLHRAVHSPVFTVAEDGMPTGDGDDEFGNQTLDFGFHSPAQPPVLSLGGALWRDADGDGQRDGGESPLSEVGLTLLRIQPDGSDYWVQGGGTDELGNYRFSGLPAGTYRVVVWNWNFGSEGPLAGLFSSPGASDADLDVVGDDNGVDAVDPASQSLYSRRLTLAHGTEPDASVAGEPGNGNHTLDFGFIELLGGANLSLGGTVFRDLGNDGLMESPDTGIPNAFVALWIDNGDGVFGTGDVHVGSVPNTDGNGAYRFDHLPPADYLIQMYSGQFFPGGPLAGLRSSLSDQVPELVVDPDNDVAGDDNGFESAGFGQSFMVITRPVSLRGETEPIGEDGDPNTNLTVDIGFYEGPTLELSGTVFRDENANGQQDAGETGFEGVGVELWQDHNGDGVPSEGDGHFLNAYTDAGGTYRMGPLVPGDYLVVLRYHNFMPGRPLNGWRSSLSDQAPEPWVDPNTDADGDDNGFEFGGWGRAFFGVGTRRVTLAFGTEPDADIDGNGPNGNATLDFGFVAGPSATVGNLVFRDANNNGVRDGDEPGLANVHVKLFYDNGDGELGDGDEDLGVDVYTDAAGAYSLPGLPKGRYLVVLPWDNWWPGRALNGLRSSRSDASPEPAVDLETNRTEDDDNGQERTLSWWPSVQVASRAFTVAPGEVRGDVDFGFYAGPTLTLAGTVFRDEDNSGVRDEGEAAVPGVAVQLYQDNGDGVLHHGDWHLGDATTDAEGNYRFAGLMPGHYAVAIRRDNHFYGRALTNLRTSTGNDPAPDPDNDVDGDDNGAEVTAFDDPQFGVACLPITLVFGLEPNLPEDGNDAYSNATLDFGFRPVVGTTFMVTDAGDGDDGVCDAHCTLREAIRAANAHPGTDTITFAIGGGGLQTIVVGSALPALIEPVVLDATTQPGYGEMPLIELRGDSAGPGVAGLLIDGGSSVVRGFVINRFDHGGIHLRGGSGSVVQGNFIGTDPAGTMAPGGTSSDHGGIYVVNSDENQIGGLTAVTRNLVSGLNVGIRVENGRDNVIEGNRVGTDVTGTFAVGNYGRAGIWVLGGGQNRIGGVAPGAGNLISGNNTGVDVYYGAGVLIEWSEGTVVEGNSIGTDAAGQVALGNATGLMTSGPGVRVGGFEEGSGNVISGNQLNGVNLGGECSLIGNLIGTDRTGTQPLGNASVGVGLWGVQNVVGGPAPAERNVISANGGDGVVIWGGPGNGGHVIQGNFIGTDITGRAALGNGAGGWGPGIRTGGENGFNVIGGLEPGAGNLIAGNVGSQVDLRSSDNQVLGNRIGTDVTGTTSLLPASGGVGVFETAERNLIAGNLISGVDRAIYLAGPGVRASRVLGNRIGTNPDGTGPLANVVGVDVNESSDNVIGGTNPSEANIIAFSQAYGVGVSGAAAVNNTIRGNAIHDNGSLPGDWLGLDLLSGALVAPNDAGDADEGPNHLQNHPVLLDAAASATTLAVGGRLSSAPNTRFAVDFYANAACDPVGYGEGERYLGTIEVLTDAAGDGHFHVNLPVTVVPGASVTATATDPAGNTSEFSACRAVEAEGAPVVRQVATQGAPDQLAVFFSEAVSKATAEAAANYSLSCGLSVVSATLLDDGRTVRLQLNGAVPATGCVLTVNGVQDLAEPANTIVANTQADIFQALGVITRREYRHVPYGQLVDLVNHPRFPNQPSVVDYPTAFESPADQGDNYGVQMLGYVHPPVTGEYVFYLSGDDTAELYLSTDETPRNKQLIAVEVGPNPPYQWTDGNRAAGAAPESVLANAAFFIEAEDFNFGGGGYVTDAPIGMDGSYVGGAYAALGGAGDAEIDWHDAELDNPAAHYGYRAATGVECYLPGDRGDRLARGSFEVTVSYSLGWQAVGDWQNYTRDFGAGGDYYVFARVASGGEPIALQLDEVVEGAATSSQTTMKLGEFRSGSTGVWDMYSLVPLTGDDGDFQIVTLAGTRTLRTTTLAGNNDFDYLVFVPAIGTPPPFLRPANTTAPVWLEAGRRYYIEALMKEGGGSDHLAVTWQAPGEPVPANGSAPLAAAFLEAWVEPDVTTAPFVGLGGLVFRDADNNGRYDSPEDTAIPGVTVELWMDQNADNVLHHGDWQIGQAMTDADGRYRFEGLHPGAYLAVISQGEHFYGRPLTGLRTSTGNDPAPDPDNDVAGEDHGYEAAFFDGQVGERIATRALTLTPGGEPDVALDGDGPSSNQTLDFGFRPVTGATFIVNTADDADDGACDLNHCSLREAIRAANTHPGKDTIAFAIAGTGPHTIQPQSWLPDLYESAILDATTQSGYDGAPLIVIAGQLAGDGVIGLRLYGGSSEARGLCVHSFKGGALHLAYGSQNLVAACYIGTDVTGSHATLPFQGGYYFAGITLDSPQSLIGGTQAAERNLISGYDTGVWVRSSDNRIAGNFIGTDALGTSAIGNVMGVYLESGDRNDVGGFDPAARNVLSGNQAGLQFGNGSQNRVLSNFIGTDHLGVAALPNDIGIAAYGGGGGNVIGAPSAGNLVAGNRNTNLDIRSSGNRIQANFIGTDLTGTQPLGATQGGLYFADNASGNLVGGAAAGEGNLVSGHLGAAIQVAGPYGGHRFLGNRIGSDLTGTQPLPNGAGIVLNESPGNHIGGADAGEGNLIAFNRGSGVIVGGDLAVGNVIRGNSIHANGDPDAGLPGIDLAYGPLLTPNDLGDGDEGPNRVQNYPDLLFASASETALLVEGTLNSLAGTTFTLDFYASPTCDLSGYGEGKRYLGSTEVTTDGSGNVWLLVNLAVVVPPGQFLTATATDPAGNTSEFSRCLSVLDEAPPAVVVATTQGSTDQLTVTFSESLDPTTANDPARYHLTCGTVTAASLGADRRTVTLSYIGSLMPGCTLTVYGVTDLAGVPVAVDTPALVLNTQGVISRYVYEGVEGWRIADLKAAPRFPDDPHTTAYESAFEAPTDFADSYGQKLAGYITAPVTGDYVFHLASDDGGELYLSPDADPTRKERVAQVSYWILQPRAWNDGVIHVPAEQVLRAGTLFIEAEDFDFDGGQYVTDQAIGMTGDYQGGAYAGRGSSEDEGIDWHDTSADVPDAQNYRPSTAVETLPISRTEDLDRGTFTVSVNHKLGWNDAGEWHNYTRDLGDVARDFWVVARLSSGAGPIAAELAQVTAGQGTVEQSTVKLGEFRSPPPGNPNSWDNFVFVPLTGEDGQPVRVNFGGVTTLRFTTLPGNHDFDYLALVPAGTETWVARPENQSAPIPLVAGQRYYIEALMKEGSGGDHLAVTWQMPGAPAPRNGDAPIPGAYLSSEAAAVITRQPVDQAVLEGEPAAFSVEVRGEEPLSIHWYRDGEPIDGATGTSYTLPAVSLLDDDGARFQVWVSNGFGTEISQEVVLTVMSLTPVLEELVPQQAAANGPGFTLRVSGQGFSSRSVVYWNGEPRSTTYRSPFELEAVIPDEDLATTASLWTVPVTVVGPNSAVSQPLPFTLFDDQQVTEAVSAIAIPGGVAQAGIVPQAAGEAGVAAAAANNGSLSDPLIVTVGTYESNPTGTLTFDVGGGFVDLQLTGADPSDRVRAYFYYPTTLTGRTEEKLRLLYFDGTRWAHVRSDGLSLPVKVTADGLTYGGYFDVTFSDTSVPRVTELSGTVFTFTDSEPEITALAGPTGPLPLGSTATLAVEFVAVGSPETHTVRFDWDDGTATTLNPVEDGFVSATHVYAAAGVYTVRVRVTDAEGDAAEVPFEYVVVYDPAGGFVTGGGWILSPPGAYRPLPTVSGKATFGFVSRYKKGAQVPSGNTEFQFIAAGLRFTSTAYDWLVVSGPKAQYKGVGVINDRGDYGFLLTAVDGQLNGGGGADRLRLKIWERATGVVVYDNAPSVSDDLERSSAQALGGGSIVIHR